jgi:hypothetical protein
MLHIEHLCNLNGAAQKNAIGNSDDSQNTHFNGRSSRDAVCEISGVEITLEGPNRQN